MQPGNMDLEGVFMLGGPQKACLAVLSSAYSLAAELKQTMACPPCENLSPPGPGVEGLQHCLLHAFPWWVGKGTEGCDLDLVCASIIREGSARLTFTCKTPRAQTRGQAVDTPCTAEAPFLPVLIRVSS